MHKTQAEIQHSSNSRQKNAFLLGSSNSQKSASLRHKKTADHAKICSANHIDLDLFVCFWGILFQIIFYVVRLRQQQIDLKKQKKHVGFFSSVETLTNTLVHTLSLSLTHTHTGQTPPL